MLQSADVDQMHIQVYACREGISSIALSVHLGLRVVARRSWLHWCADQSRLSEEERQLLQDYQQGRLQARVDEIRKRRAGLALRLGQLVSSEQTDACRNTRSAASAAGTASPRTR